MSTFLTLTSGHTVAIDVADALQFKGVTLDYSNGYARVRGGRLVHEMLLEASFHLNANRLDNRRSNLTQVQPVKVTGLFGIYRMPGVKNIYYVISGDHTKGPFLKVEQAKVAYNILNTGKVNKVDPINPRGGKGPEAKIQAALIDFLEARGWVVKVMIGTAMQSGFPDLFCCHKAFGTRLIDVKNPKSWCLTPAQKEFWPKLSANGSGVYILTAATEYEYAKLFGPNNWHAYYR